LISHLSVSIFVRGKAAADTGLCDVLIESFHERPGTVD
jgi:hypothetical protein